MLPGLAQCAQLRSQPVRDLAYLLTAPPPWHSGVEISCQRLLGPQGWPQLLALDANPGPLLAWLAARPTRRLGLYAEALLAYWFSHAPHIALVAANLPVRDGTHTVGEFDFLLRIDGEPYHLEAASKFYLQLDSAPHALVGPGLRDAWWLKYRKLASQLALVQHPATRLPAGFEQASACSRLTGWLFFPAGAADTHPAIHTAACRGWWCRLQDSWPQQHPHSRWLALPRLQWLGPAQADEAATQSLAAMRAQLAQADGPWLLAELLPDAQGVWQEVARGFVVPDSWPDPDLLATLLPRLAA